MKKLLLSFFCIFSLIIFNNFSAQAQKSAKTKSSDKLYERGFVKRKVDIRNCSNVNSKALEYSPAFYQNGLVFVSNRNANGPRDNNIKSTFFQLYYAENDRNNFPMKPVEFSFELNSERHEGPLTFSRDGNTVYFTRNNEKNGYSKKDATGKVRMKIYEAKRGLRDWQDVRELSFNSDDFTCFHPTLSADGRYLYFSSDMPGGYGDFDLYVSERKGDTWLKPVNLGPKVNSAKKDAFPFMHESGILFFSSNRDGFGGLDIFAANLSKTEIDVFNIGEPFNSADDDLGFILEPNGMTGYFSSNRREKTFGQDDIFMFDVDEPLTNETYNINGTIVINDAATKEAVAGAAVRIFERSGNGMLNNGNWYDVLIEPDNNGNSKIKLVRKQATDLGKPDKFSTTAGSVNYNFKNERDYIILVTKDGYEDAELQYTTLGRPQGLDTIAVQIGKPACAQLVGQVVAEKTNARIPSVIVTIMEGSNAIQTLRTNDNGTFETCLKPNKTYTFTYEKEGFGKAKPQTITVGNDISKPYSSNISLVPNEAEVLSKPITTGTVIVLENIYYDFNKAIIRADATKELDALASLMQRYKTMEVELSAHTDSRGNNEYNLKLSTARALAAKNYLVGLGIDIQRISSRGAGESNIRNRCADGVDCPEEEHQYNRRTEVRVTKINEGVEVKYGK